MTDSDMVSSNSVGGAMQSELPKTCHSCKEEFASNGTIVIITESDGNSKLFHQLCHDTSDNFFDKQSEQEE